LIRRALVLVVPLVGIAANAVPSRAQIINTLRGWEEPEPGWSGELEGRLAFASGNSDYLELSASAAIQLLTTRQRIRVLVHETRRRANGQEVVNAFLAHVRHNFRLSDLVWTLVFAQHQYSPFLRLERRSLLGAGTRLDVVRAEGWDASIGLSAMIESEVLTDEPGGAARVDGRGSFFLSGIGDVTDDLRVDVSAFYQPLLDEWSDSRAYVAAVARVDVVGGLDLLVRFDLLHDSNPPPDVEQTDLRLSTGLLLDF